MRRPCNTANIVGRTRADADMVECPVARPAARPGGHGCLALPNTSNGPQRRVLVVGIEIEERLEEHERHTVESDGVVAEPAPCQLRVVSAAEPVLLCPRGIGIVEVA